MTTTVQLNRIPSLTHRTGPQDRWNRAVTALIFAAILFPVSYTVADPDLWGHVRFGQDILAAKRLATVDPYSYTSGTQRWINHELFAEILFGWVYNSLGAAGLVCLKTAVIMATLGVVFWSARRAGLDSLAAGMLTFLTAVLVLPDAIMVRPHIFTYLFFAITLVILRQADDGRLRRLWLLPPLYALWINTHGGVLAGVGMLLAWAAVYLGAKIIAQRQLTPLGSREARLIYAVIGTAGIALLATPYGWTLIAFLVRTGTVPRPEITEWRTIHLLSFEGAGYAVYLIGMALAIWYSGYHRPRRVMLLALGAVLPLLAQRHLPLAALIFALLGVDFVAHAWRRWSAAQTSSLQPSPRLAGAVWGVALALTMCCLGHFRGISVDAKRFPMPVRAVALLHESGVSGNLAVFFDWGEYVIWHVGPKVRVSVDGRRETVYNARSYRQNVNFMRGTNRWDAILTDYPTNLVLVQRGSATANLMRQRSDWELVYQDRLSVLLAKRGSRQALALHRTSAPNIAPYGKGLRFPVTYRPPMFSAANRGARPSRRAQSIVMPVVVSPGLTCFARRGGDIPCRDKNDTNGNY